MPKQPKSKLQLSVINQRMLGFFSAAWVELIWILIARRITENIFITDRKGMDDPFVKISRATAELNRKANVLAINWSSVACGFLGGIFSPPVKPCQGRNGT